MKSVHVALPGGRGGGNEPGDDYPARLKNLPQMRFSISGASTTASAPRSWRGRSGMPWV